MAGRGEPVGRGVHGVGDLDPAQVRDRHPEVHEGAAVQLRAACLTGRGSAQGLRAAHVAPLDVRPSHAQVLVREHDARRAEVHRETHGDHQHHGHDDSHDNADGGHGHEARAAHEGHDQPHPPGHGELLGVAHRAVVRAAGGRRRPRAVRVPGTGRGGHLSVPRVVRTGGRGAARAAPRCGAPGLAGGRGVLRGVLAGDGVLRAHASTLAHSCARCAAGRPRMAWPHGRGTSGSVAAPPETPLGPGRGAPLVTSARGGGPGNGPGGTDPLLLDGC